MAISLDFPNVFNEDGRTIEVGDLVELTQKQDACPEGAQFRITSINEYGGLLGKFIDQLLAARYGHDNMGREHTREYYRLSARGLKLVDPEIPLEGDDWE